MVCIGLIASSSSRRWRSSSLRPWACSCRPARSCCRVSSTPLERSAIFCSTARASSASRCWRSALTCSLYSATTLRRRAVASLPPLSPAATMTSPVGPNAMASSATPVLSSDTSASVAWAAAAISSVRAARWLSRSALVRASSSFSSSFCLLTFERSSSSSSARRSPALPPRPSASSSIAASARLRASSSTWVTMYSAKYRIRSRLRGLMSSRMPSRLGVPLKYQMWLTGLASWM